jgi:hypothetical protein
MGICLICTLGNRDIQFKEKYGEIIKEKLNIDVIKNRDDNNYYVVNPHNFKPLTKKILDNYENIKEYIEIPMIDKILNKYNNIDKNIDKIYLIATDQKNEKNEAHKVKDTIYEADIIKKVLRDKYNQKNVEIVSAEFNAKDMEEWFKLIKGLFNNILKENKKIIIEFSGGMNETKEAIRLASLFNDNITVYEIIDNEPKDMNSYFYEKSIVNEKVRDLIKNYNYSGALSFKKYYKDNKKVLNLIEHLNYRLNFDFDNALKCYNEDRLKKLMSESNTIKKLEYLILELLDNMEIELKNGNYANFLARVYRLEEAMGQYFVLKWLKRTKTNISYKLGDNPSSGLTDVANIGVEDLNNKLGSYLRYLSYNKMNKNIPHRGVRKLVEFIDENCKKKDRFGNPTMKDGKFEYIININTPTYEKLIKYLYGDYSNEIRIYEKIQKMYKKGRNNLRHTTIVAHGFEGIGEYELNRMLKENGELKYKNIEPYFKELRRDFYKLAKTDDKNIFDKINEEIVGKL